MKRVLIGVMFLFGAMCGAVAHHYWVASKPTLGVASPPAEKKTSDKAFHVTTQVRSDGPSGRLPTPPAPKQRRLDPKSAQAFRNVQNGDAVLDSDIPAVRKLREDTVASGVAYAMSIRGKDYEKQFRNMGLDDRAVEQLMGHVAAIFEARIDLQNEATQLLNARENYDQRIKALLGERYDEYEKYELMDSARRESEFVAKWANRRGLALTEQEAATITSLIAEFGAYSQDVKAGLGGVFHDWPPPLNGPQSAIVFAAQRNALQQQATALLARADAIGLNPRAKSLLADYYAQKAGELSKTEDAMRNPTMPASLQAARAKAKLEIEAARAKAKLPAR